MTMYRQGDVMLRRAATIPVGNTKTLDRATIALGEVTGHAHILTGDLEETVIRDADLERRFIRVLGDGGVLTHEEHATIQIPPGDYDVVRQREYAEDDLRFVAD